MTEAQKPLIEPPDGVSERLNARTPADLLGYIPYLLGFWPESSLVVLTLKDKCLGASMRVDLPSLRHDDLRSWAKSVAGAVLADGETHSSLLAIYPGRDWLDEDDPGFDAMVAALMASLGDIGLPVHGAWWVGTSRYRDYLCRDPFCHPPAGDPLTDLTSSMVSTEMIYRGKSYAARLDLTDYLRRLSSEYCKAARGAALNYALKYCDVSWYDGSNRAMACADQLQSWEAVLSGATNLDANPLRAGFLLAGLSSPVIRDAVLTSALAGRAESDRLLRDDDPFTGGNSGRTGQILLGPDIAPGGEAGDIVPQWDRLAKFEEALGALAAIPVPRAVQAAKSAHLAKGSAACFALLGWVHWCQGKGSVADLFLRKALKVSPGYSLARLLIDAQDSGFICGWARRSPADWQEPPHAA